MQKLITGGIKRKKNCPKNCLKKEKKTYFINSYADVQNGGGDARGEKKTAKIWVFCV